MEHDESIKSRLSHFLFLKITNMLKFSKDLRVKIAAVCNVVEEPCGHQWIAQTFYIMEIKEVHLVFSKYICRVDLNIGIYFL